MVQSARLDRYPRLRNWPCYPEESEDSIANNKWLEKRTWIIWYSRDIDGVLWSLTSERDHESLRNEPSTILGYRRRCYPPFENSEYQTDLPIIPKICLSPENSRKYPLLHFWTMVASYTVHATSPTTASIFDGDRAFCGHLFLNCGLPPSTHDSKFDVLILSESQDWAGTVIESGLFKPFRSSIPIEEEDGLQEKLELFWVMLIIWDGRLRRGG